MLAYYVFCDRGTHTTGYSVYRVLISRPVNPAIDLDAASRREGMRSEVAGWGKSYCRLALSRGFASDSDKTLFKLFTAFALFAALGKVISMTNCKSNIYKSPLDNFNLFDFANSSSILQDLRNHEPGNLMGCLPCEGLRLLAYFLYTLAYDFDSHDLRRFCLFFAFPAHLTRMLTRRCVDKKWINR